ncbi:MAG: hypothetical protein ACFFB8_06495 [Promethearchaeota archaeon]
MFFGNINHLTAIIVPTIVHDGFSFIEILKPAIFYRKWEEQRERCEYLEIEPAIYFETIKTAKEKHQFRKGAFYRTERTMYHKELYGEHNPIINRLSRYS